MNFVISIIKPESHEIMTEICESLALPITVSHYGRGTAVQSMLELLGIDSNERRIVTSVADEEKTTALIAALTRQLHIGVPGHGIVIAMPIKSIGGGRTVAYLTDESKNAKYTPPRSFAYELIVAITSEGCTDMVMNAARAAGARGGTVLHGKGTGSRDTQKFYNISIAEEKEVVLIVAAAERKTEIMQSVLHKAGPDTEAGTILFSLPASEVAGFGFFDEE